MVFTNENGLQNNYLITIHSMINNRSILIIVSLWLIKDHHGLYGNYLLFNENKQKPTIDYQSINCGFLWMDCMEIMEP
jgi:hypothetical protein